MALFVGKLDLVGADGGTVADVEDAIDYDGAGPVLVFAVGEFEFGDDFAGTFGVDGAKADGAVFFAVADEAAGNEDVGGFAGFFDVVDHGAVFGVEQGDAAGTGAAGVNDAVAQGGALEVVVGFVFPEEFGGVVLDFKAVAAVAVAGGEVELVGADDEGGIGVDGVFVFVVVAPEFCAGLGVEAGDAVLEEGDELLFAVEGAEGGGAVAGGLFADEGFPDFFAGVGVERDDAGGGAAGGGDDFAVVDVGRFGIAPGGVLAAVFFGGVEGPEDLAVGSVEAGEHAGTAHDVNFAVVEGGGGAGHFEAFAPLRAVVLGPEDFAGGFIEAAEDAAAGLFVAGAAGDVEFVAEDGGGGVAGGGEFGLPEEGRAVFGPLFEQAGFGADEVAVGTAPVGPIGGGEGGGGEGEEGEEGDGGAVLHGVSLRFVLLHSSAEIMA